MKRLIYQVAVGDDAHPVPEFYIPCVESVRQYAKRIEADHHVQTEPRLRIVPTGPGAFVTGA